MTQWRSRVLKLRPDAAKLKKKKIRPFGLVVRTQITDFRAGDVSHVCVTVQRLYYAFTIMSLDLYKNHVRKGSQPKDRCQGLPATNAVSAFPNFSSLSSSRKRSGRDQALGPWSGSTDSKTPVNQRTKPREYQTVRTHTKETTGIQDPASPPTTRSTLCRMPQLNSKQNKNTDPAISRQDYHLTQPRPSEEKETNHQKLSTNLTL